MHSEKAMATHSSILAWKIPWTEETGGLPSLGSHRVGHDSSDLAAAARKKMDKELNLHRAGNYQQLKKHSPSFPWHAAVHGVTKSRTQLRD